MLNGTMPDVLSQLYVQWQKYRESWQSYEIMAAMAFEDGRWQPLFFFVTGRFEPVEPTMERLPASIDGLAQFYRGVWTAETFERFLSDAMRNGPVTFPLENGLEVSFEPFPQASLTWYGSDTDFYEPQKYDPALRYLLCTANLPSLRDSMVTYQIATLMVSKGYSSLEDMLGREFQLRHAANLLQIVLPLGIQVDATLENATLNVHIEMQPYLANDGPEPEAYVGHKQSESLHLNLDAGSIVDGWVRFSGRIPVTDQVTSVWVSHPLFPAEFPQSNQPQIFRVDVVAAESRPAEVSAERDLVDLLFQNTDKSTGDGLKQWAQWMAQVSNRDGDRATHLEVALATRLVFAGARVYYSGTPTGTKGVDMAALWSHESPPKALVVSATTEASLVKTSDKLRAFADVQEQYRDALRGYEVLFALAVPITMDLIPFGVIMEAARHRMAILAKEDLEELRNLDMPATELWRRLVRNPDNLHAVVTQEFSQINPFADPLDFRS